MKLLQEIVVADDVRRLGTALGHNNSTSRAACTFRSDKIMFWFKQTNNRGNREPLVQPHFLVRCLAAITPGHKCWNSAFRRCQSDFKSFKVILGLSGMKKKNKMYLISQWCRTCSWLPGTDVALTQPSPSSQISTRLPRPWWWREGGSGGGRPIRGLFLVLLVLLTVQLTLLSWLSRP